MAAAGAAEVAQALSRPLSCLQEPGCGRAARLRALEAIRAEVQERPLPSAVLQEVFGAQLVRPLARCLAGDAAERCRELALQLLCHGLSRGERPGEALPVLLPALAQRLCPPQGSEPSEELRLGLVQLLRLLLQRCGACAVPYLTDVTRILQATLLDHYAEVRRESCRCAVACAQAMPGGTQGWAERGSRGLMRACGVPVGRRRGGDRREVAGMGSGEGERDEKRRMPAEMRFAGLGGSVGSRTVPGMGAEQLQRGGNSRRRGLVC